MRRSYSSPRSVRPGPCRWRTMNPSTADTVSWRMEGMRPGCGSAMKRKPWNMWKCRSPISTGSCSVTGMISVSGRCGAACRSILRRRNWMRCVKDWWKILAPCNYRGMYALVVERQVLHFVVFAVCSAPMFVGFYESLSSVQCGMVLN